MTKLTWLAALVLIGLSNPAWAHPHLLAADPPVGGKLAASPRAIRLTFSEPVFASFSGAVVHDAAGRTVKTGKSTLDPANPRVLVIALAAALPPGAYQVEWRAVAADTHRVTGSFGFTIG